MTSSYQKTIHWTKSRFFKLQPKLQYCLVALLLVMTALLAYANSLPNPFYSDDIIFFNKAETDLRYFFYHFLPNRDAILGIQKMQGDFFYRPLSYIVPSLAYVSFGKAVWGHHLVNIFLLALGGWAVFWLVFSLAKDFAWSLMAGLLYVVHPINGVVVNYITAGVFGLQAFFMVFALLAVHKGKTCQAVIWSLFAIFCHETAMMLPFYAAWMVWLKSDHIKEVWRKTWALWLLLACYFLLRLFFIPWQKLIFDKVPHFDMNAFEYLASEAKIILWYVSRLFYPQGIVLIWSTLVVQGIVVSFWLAAGLLFIIFIAAGVYYYRQVYLVRVVLGWFILGFLPVGLASLFKPPHGLMIEPHWFVFSSIGFFIWTAFMLKDHLKIVGVILILAWLSLGWRYNQLWSNEKQYCLFWLNEAPQMKATAYVLGDIYANERKWTEAKYYFQRSFRGTYQDWLTYLKMGILEAEDENWESASLMFQKAYSIAPNEPAVRHALGHFYQRLKIKGIKLSFNQ